MDKVKDRLYANSPFDLGSENDNKYRDSIDSVLMGNDKLANCPLCLARLQHEKVNTTHVYTCGECPFVGFEYYSAKNTGDLANKLDTQ